jgi:hypothetical protein
VSIGPWRENPHAASEDAVKTASSIAPGKDLLGTGICRDGRERNELLDHGIVGVAEQEMPSQQISAEFPVARKEYRLHAHVNDPTGSSRSRWNTPPAKNIAMA